MPNFWSVKESEPKREHRWIMNIGGIPHWLVKKVSKPSITVSESKHVLLNHAFYYPGVVNYEKTSVTLVDPVHPDATAMMWNVLFQSGYGIPDNPDDKVTMNKESLVGALGNVTISQLGGDGNIVEEYMLLNPWVAGVKFGELDYESDNLVNLTLDLRYDFVKFTRIADNEWQDISGGGAEGSDTPDTALNDVR